MSKQLTAEMIRNNLIQKLKSTIQPIEIELIDDSEKHAGHAGSRAGGASHFKLWIVSERFVGLSAIARHRLVYDALADDMKHQIHALNIVAKTPEEIAG